MLDVLRHRSYRHLFGAQVIALVGTGLATVALGLLAYDLASGNAGQVLGTALAIKMVAYIGVAPVASAFAERLPRRTVLVALDLVRAAVALALPLVSEIWQVYLLIFLLQCASAGFTPTFQATIPDLLPDERAYTKALSLSRLAYDLESLASPVLAAALLALVSYHSLFLGTMVGFLASAALVLSTVFPQPRPGAQRPIYERTTRGLQICLVTPRLRGLLALNLTLASASAMVIVNTVVIVQHGLQRSQEAVALALAAYGAGSMLVALCLPRLLETLSDRRVMLTGGGVLVAGLFAGGLAASRYETLLALWFLLGIGGALVQTPTGRLLRRSSRDEDRPALFAAQFALSHACWLLTYPVAGWVGAAAGTSVSFVLLAATACLALVVASRLWPAVDPVVVAHDHLELSPDHPHWDEHAAGADQRHHAHPYFIDGNHRRWPE